MLNSLINGAKESENFSRNKRIRILKKVKSNRIKTFFSFFFQNKTKRRNQTHQIFFFFQDIEWSSKHLF